MTPSKHLSDEQKKLFRDIVRKAKDLKTLHEIDRYQIEQAAVLIDQIRTMTVEMNMTIDDAEDELSMVEVIAREKMKLQIQRTFTALNTSLNSTMDKLGLSKMKREPKKRPRGAPTNVGPPASKKESNPWHEALQVVNGGKK